MSLARPALAVLAVLHRRCVRVAQEKEPDRRSRNRRGRRSSTSRFATASAPTATSASASSWHSRSTSRRLGFDDARKNDPDRDLDILDPTPSGSPARSLRRTCSQLLDDPRVLNILFAPAGYTYPDSPDKPVPIRIILRGGLLPAQQQVLHDQTLRATGTARLPRGARLRHPRLHATEGNDPVQEPRPTGEGPSRRAGGWFLADTPPDRLPRPFADRNPIRWVEVMPAAEQPPPFVPEPLSPDSGEDDAGTSRGAWRPGREGNARSRGGAVLRADRRPDRGTSQPPRRGVRPES